MPLNLASTGGGSVTLQADSTASTYTQTIPAVSGTNGPIVSGTTVASTSGTAIDFTGVPSWVKRITIMFNGVSSSGTTSFLVQIGSGSITSTGYNSTAGGCINAAAPAVTSSTAGFLVFNDTAADIRSGNIIISYVGSNIYVQSNAMGGTGGRSITTWGGGSVTLGGVLDRVRITTVNGTDTFDAGSINILYE